MEDIRPSRTQDIRSARQVSPLIRGRMLDRMFLHYSRSVVHEEAGMVQAAQIPPLEIRSLEPLALSTGNSGKDSPCTASDFVTNELGVTYVQGLPRREPGI